MCLRQVAQSMSHGSSEQCVRAQAGERGICGKGLQGAKTKRVSYPKKGKEGIHARGSLAWDFKTKQDKEGMGSQFEQGPTGQIRNNLGIKINNYSHKW